MATIKLIKYIASNGQLIFETYGPLPLSATVTVMASSDNGATWTENEGAPFSPRNSIFVLTRILFKLRINPSGEMSNIISSDNQLIRTEIYSESQITFANSPVHLRIQNTDESAAILSAEVRLWIWNGNMNKILGSPNVVLKKDKISKSDNYISFEISDIIKSYLQRPVLSSSNNQPGFGYNQNSLPAITGQGIFWQVQYSVFSKLGLLRNVVSEQIADNGTNFATLGWRWNYEQNGQNPFLNTITKHGSLGFDEPIKKWFNPNVPKYFKQDFVLTNTIEETSTTSMISIDLEEKIRTRCTKDSCILVYLDKRGLFDVFTPHGKIVVTSRINSDNSSLNFRDSSKVNNSIAHSKSRNSLLIEQNYLINTGSIDESDVQRVEELIYSPKIYLIKFNNEIIKEISDGITIDSTLITIDDTEITIDNTPTKPTQVPFYSKHQQIPVIITDTDFTRKTLMNDKSGIDYNIRLSETNNKINDIR